MGKVKSRSEIMLRCNFYFHSLIFLGFSNFANSYQVSNHYGTQVHRLLSENIVFLRAVGGAVRIAEK